MNVLIACEYSGVVRDAFKKRGHRAVSCDLLPTERRGEHYRGDVRDLLNDEWDLMIAHPPCQYLAVSGNAWAARPERQAPRRAAIQFFMDLAEAPIPMICIENPVGIMSSLWRPPDQYVQPWQFGDAESKKTGLWLKNLSPLRPTRILSRPARGYWNNQTPSGQNRLPPSADRWKLRAATYQGIADAMASQWG